MAPARLQFVVGIEDKQPFLWQLAVFLESLRGRLPEGWRTFVAVCNDHAALSAPLAKILSTYGARWTTAANYSERRDIDLMGGKQSYGGLNKIGALEAAAPFVPDEELICLLDTDLFLFGELNTDIFPSRNALVKNWLIKKPLFFSARDRCEGVDLQKLLGAIEVEREFRGGGVIMFFTGATLRTRGFVQDCFRFAQTLYLLGKIKQVFNQWLSEMPAYALALTARGIDYEVINPPEFAVDNTKAADIRRGSWYHYFAPHAFAGSSWGKYHFRNRDLLEADLDRFLELAQTEHERCFFRLAVAARERLQAETSERLPAKGPVADRVHYWHYHLRHAVDPQAAPGKDLSLPRAMGLMYRLLGPARGLRGRLEERLRLKKAAVRAAEKAKAR